MADGAVYHFRVGKPDGFAIMGSPGWRIGQGKSNILIAEGSAYSMPIGLHLLQALTNEALTMTDSEAVKTMSARTGGRCQGGAKLRRG